jgi:small conductance mechanosensitive channel
MHSIIRYIIYFVVVVMLLQEFRIDTTSIVAGAGIIGLALGVGAQSLIKDFVTGFFIILEDQYGVGDYIAIGDMGGTVEELGFRITKLRDGNGILHIIPNGSVTKVSNYTRGHMQAAVNVPVAYDADMEQVFAILNEVCNIIEKTNSEVIERPDILGVVDLKPGEIVIRIIAKTVPLQQVKVETALRRLIKDKFTEANILPPQLSVILPQNTTTKAGG